MQTIIAAAPKQIINHPLTISRRFLRFKGCLPNCTRKGLGRRLRAEQIATISVLDSLQHTLVSLLCLFFLGIEAEASETGSPSPRLSGIVSLAEVKRAVVESPSGSGSAAGWSVLAEGQREGQFAVLEIHPDTATVRARLHARTEPTDLSLTNPAARLPRSSGIVLEIRFGSEGGLDNPASRRWKSESDGLGRHQFHPINQRPIC